MKRNKLLEKQRLNENANKLYGNQSIDNNQMLTIQSETTGNKSSESKSLTDFNNNQLNITKENEDDNEDDKNEDDEEINNEDVDFTDNLNPTKAVMIEHILEKKDIYNDLYKKYTSGINILYKEKPTMQDKYYEYTGNELIQLIDGREGRNEQKI